MVAKTKKDTKEEVFVHQTAIRKNPRKYLLSVGGGDTELDVGEGEKAAGTARTAGPGGAPVQDSNTACCRHHGLSPSPGASPPSPAELSEQ